MIGFEALCGRERRDRLIDLPDRGQLALVVRTEIQKTSEGKGNHRSVSKSSDRSGSSTGMAGLVEPAKINAAVRK